jgi:CheY-like chemotaxis protein
MDSLAGMNVLLVEDNIVNQKVAVGCLSQKGVQVDVVSNGQEALDQLERKNREDYDLILMDMEMPVMDGFTATRHIRESPIWQSIPIIAMTAHAIKGVRERCLAAGMNRYLSKPIVPVMLYQALAEIKNLSEFKP